jgi:hypothetical protein
MGHPYLTDHMWEVVEYLQTKDIRISSGESQRRTPASMERGLAYPPISFTPARTAVRS